MRPKPSLGQHFLKSQGVVDRIIALAAVGKNDHVLEIGPGTGALTRSLVRHAGRLVAVEKDDALARQLREEFGNTPSFGLVHGDILECPMDGLVTPGMKVVANLPYNVATQIILRLTPLSRLLACIVVMVQKEVGSRICAKAGDSDYAALSVLLSSLFSCTPGFLVGPENFYPEPKVDSQVIKLVPREDPLPGADRGDYRTLVFTAFGQRRKMLRNSLLGLPGMTKNLLPELARLSGANLDARPQELAPEAFAKLFRAYRQIIDA